MDLKGRNGHLHENAFILIQGETFTGFAVNTGAQAPRDVVRDVGDSSVIYKIPNPEPGIWRVKIFRRPNRLEDKVTSQGELPAVFGFSSLPAF